MAGTRPGAAVVWFPVVGALLGAGLVGAYAGIRPSFLRWWPRGGRGLGVVLIRALHEDGLADTADPAATAIPLWVVGLPEPAKKLVV